MRKKSDISPSVKGSFEFQLFGEEIISRTLIDEEGLRVTGAGSDKLRGIVFLPCLAVIAQVTVERFLAPGALAGRHDGCERRDRLVGVRI